MGKFGFFLLTSVLFSSYLLEAKKTEEKSPFSGKVRVSYGKGFDLFSEGTVSTYISLYYFLNKKANLNFTYSYKNDPDLTLGYRIYENKKKKTSFSGGLTGQIPITQKSRDNELLTAVTGSLGFSKKIGPVSVSLLQYLTYNIYKGEVDDLGDEKLKLTNYSANSSLTASFSFLKKFTFVGNADFIQVWNFDGERTAIQSFSGKLVYKFHKQAQVYAKASSSNETISFDTLFDDDTSAYQLAFEFLF